MDDLDAVRRLLAEVFPQDGKFARSDFLQWQYETSPSGEVIAENACDDVGLLGHYAVVPQRWLWRGRVSPFALSLNTAVSERARGQGLFTRLAEATYASAADRGVLAIVGVANANSTPGFIGRLGFDLVGPLDVSIVPWRPSRQARSIDRIEASALRTDPIVAGQLGEGQPLAESATRRCWDAAELEWRLRDPRQQFAVFRGPSWLAVTCRTKHKGVPVAVITKVLLDHHEADHVELGPIAAAACRHHRAPVALHAGRNPGLRGRGLPLPDRLRPSPLNLIVKSLTAGEPSSAFVPEVFEFLEFDAY